MAQWEIDRAAGRSTLSGRPLEEGEEFYSVLLEEGESFRRVDYSLDEWEGPPEGAFCFFRTRMPIRQKRKQLLVDDELLVAFFTRLARETEPVRVQFRFVLALILMRKRLLKYEGTEQQDGQEVWRMVLPRDRSEHLVVNPHLSDDQIGALVASEIWGNSPRRSRWRARKCRRRRVRDSFGAAAQSPKRERGVFVGRLLAQGPTRLRSGLGSGALWRAILRIASPPMLSRTRRRITMRPSRALVLTAGVALAALVVGCPPRAPVALEPLPLQQAAGIVNRNLEAIPGTLRATGTVSGHVTTPAGRRVHFTLDGFLIYLGPRCLRFDLKSLAGTEMLFGSNETHYWYYSRRDDESYYCRRHDPTETLANAGIPLNPAQLIDALGLTPILLAPAVPVEAEPIQRVVAESQQLLFVVTDAEGRRHIEKEYWVERYAPRLVRQVQFRDADGVVIMESRLEGYKLLAEDGPWLPRVVEADWPTSGVQMRFRISRWRALPQVGPEALTFTPPHLLPDPIRYRHEYIED